MKKNNNYSKNDLLFYYQKLEFPQNLVLKETLTHKDFLFSEHSMEPEAMNKKKPKLANSFIFEEELESKKVPFKKGKASNARSDHNITKGNAFGTHQNTIWRKNEFEDPGFFDNFKGKSDERQVNTFKRNMELQSTKENSFCIANALFVDYLGGNNEKGKVSNLKEITASADDLFNNTDNLFSGNNDGYGYNNNKKIQKGNNASRKSSNQLNERKTSLSSANNCRDENPASPIKARFNPLSKEEKTLTFINLDPKKIDFRNIHRINKYLSYGKEEPLWYIFHPIAKSSFGPCSSENLEEMYSGGMVDGQSEVRFIDIFNIKNKKPFEFFKLKDLEDVKIIEEIEISSLVKNAVLFNNYIESNRNENNLNNINNANQANKNINSNNQNKNRRHGKNSSISNSQQLQEGSESNKEANQTAGSAKVTSPKEQPKENKKSEKKEPKDLNSLLEKVLKNDIKNKEKKANAAIAPPKAEETKPEKIESTPPPTTKAPEKEAIEISNIPSIEEVTNKDLANKGQKEKVNRNKKPTKAKPVGLDIKLKFEDSSAYPTTPSNLASNALSNTSTKQKVSKDEKPRTTKAKDSAMKKEEIMNSIYNSKSLENPEQVSNQTNTADNLTPTAKRESKSTPIAPESTAIETIKVTYDDSIYNSNNYGYSQEYYNEYDYYGTGNKTNANQANTRKNAKKQKNKNPNTNANDKNDYYGYDYQYDEGYGNNNYQGSNKNYYSNYGGFNNKQNYKGNVNYEY